MKKHFILLLMMLICSCSPIKSPLEEALEMAGKNKSELEKVLSHYKQNSENSLKYEAACFLISNMKYHKSCENIFLDNLYHDFFLQTADLFQSYFGEMSTDQIRSYKESSLDNLRKKISLKYKQLPQIETKLNTIPDLQIIKADFLINHIDLAFTLWDQNPLLENIDFDEFKEFILPYRATDECIIFNRSEINNLFRKELYKDGLSNIIFPIERYKAYIDKHRWLHEYIKTDQHIGMYDLFLPRYKMDCHNITNLTCNAFRSVGIPVTREYTPQWIDNDKKHFWCVSPDSLGIYQPYTVPDNNLGDDWEQNIKYAGKVYRQTYGANSNSPYFLAKENEYIPPIFRTPLIFDQTFRYHQTVTLRIPFNEKINNRLAYICMFNKETLNPVGWGEINTDKHEICIKQFPLNTLLIVIYYDSNKEIAITNPFIIQAKESVDYISSPRTTNHQTNICDITLKDNNLYYSNNFKLSPIGLEYIQIIPNGKKNKEMSLSRKYPEKRRMKYFQKRIPGSFFIGEKGGKTDTLHIIQNIPKPNIQQIELDNFSSYQFYYFISNDEEGVNIAELEFLGAYSENHICEPPIPIPLFSKKEKKDNDSSLFKISGKILPSNESLKKAFDRNLETFVGRQPIIGMGFNTPVVISHIRFAPRNANNMIVVGDKYTLYYYDKGWKTHATKQAEYNYLLFEEVPSGTVYWLRNNNHGNEELPFYYKDGQQLFINLNFI